MADNKNGNRPKFEIFTIIPSKNSEKDFFLKIGAAWEKKETGNLSIYLDVLPAPFIDPEKTVKGQLSYKMLALKPKDKSKQDQRTLSDVYKDKVDKLDRTHNAKDYPYNTEFGTDGKSTEELTKIDKKNQDDFNKTAKASKEDLFNAEEFLEND